MLLRLTSLVLLATAVFAANIRLYLADGGYQMAREYEVLSDRVRYLSAERGQWEEIPLELVDLDRTKKDAVAREVAEAERRATEAAEDAAIRAEREERARVPMNPGVYYLSGGELVRLEQAETVLNNSKTRSILKILAPVPIVPGKVTVEIEGASAKLRLDDRAPEFYFRLSRQERLALVKLEQKKDVRVVQTVNILPETEEMIHEEATIETFRREVDTRLYLIYPRKALEPGEYALIEYTEGEMNLQAWDFGIDK
jgi:hypothetical protein